MASTEFILLELANTVVEEHNLSVESMLRLADTLDELHVDAHIPCITFPNLIHMLSDVDHEVPQWLAASDAKLDQYKASQFNAVVKLVEARYWLGNAEQKFERLWAWQIVFGQPRHVHRQMMNKCDAQRLMDLKGSRGKFTFTTSLPEYCYEDFPDAYKILRDTCFPHAIDDAMPVFIKHFCQAKTAVLKLEKRINALERAGVTSKTCTLYTKSRNLIDQAGLSLDKTLAMAQRWHAATKRQKEYFQLPGVNIGLPYGYNIFTEYDENKAFVIHSPVDGGMTHWDSVGPLYTPIRWRPGSAWIDYFRNIRQDHPVMRRFDTDDLKKDLVPHKDVPLPYEMRLPQSIVSIWMYFARMYDNYENKFAKNGPLNDPAKTKDQLAVQAKRLSEATGEPFWHVRGMQIEYGSISMFFPENPSLAGRPRYDALGNLRFDYMGAILRELKTGHPPKDHRTQQSIAVLRADCDGDAKMGKDLHGSQ
ncbi:hypothetical protein SCUP234_02927 [Seiridium cupressi]